MSTSRLVKVGFAGSMVVFFGLLLVKTLNRSECYKVSSECYILWGTAIVSVLGGILFIELLLARKKGAEERHRQEQVCHHEQRISTAWMWGGSFIRVILITLLMGASWIIQGAFILTILGTVVGVFLDGLIRAITGHLPLENDED